MFSPTLVHDYLRQSAKLYPSKTAVICGERHLNYNELNIRSDQLATTLIDLGVKKQDRIVVFLDNSLESIISLYGILKAGGIFIIINSTIKAKKLEYILKDADAVILITHTNKAGVVKQAMKNIHTGIKIIWSGSTEHIPKRLNSCSTEWDSTHNPSKTFGNNITNNYYRTIDMDLAALIYTSGSTGEPKGVMSSHFNMISAARSIIEYLENRRDDVILNVLPLSFDYGLYQVIMAVMFGGTVVLERSFTYIHSVLKRINEEKITGFPIVPTILAMILKLPDFNQYDFNSLRYISNTGAALPIAHIKKIRSLFPEVKLFSMFGLTECKRVCYLPPEEVDKRPGSVGKAMPNCEVFIFNDQGEEAAPDEIGELVIRGANVMKGYWNSPELTSRVFRTGRFSGETLLYSGDFFKKDNDGYLYFIGRKDDMIKSKGERLSAKEIENAICEKIGVAETAVIGVPDEIFGQAIKAYVVCGTDNQLTENDILQHCKKHLEPFAIPKYIQFVKELPKTANGKIDKKALNNHDMNPD